MINHTLRFALAGAFISVVNLAAADEPRAGIDWPQFRGIQAGGISEGKPLPVEWNAAGRDVQWKVPIPGLAHSSAIVWGDRVFVTTAVPASGEKQLRVGLYGAGDSAGDMVEHAFKLYCLDKRNGTVRWERTAASRVPRFRRHTKATHANSTPAADGRHVIAFFGSEGMYCYDFEGNLKWSRDLGRLDVGPHNAPELEWGFASSPIIAQGRVIVQCDVKSGQFIAALDIKDGREIWRTRRDDVPSWCTPTAFQTGGGWQVLANGCRDIAAYDLSSGESVWQLSGGGGIPVPAPVVCDNRIYLTSNHRPIRESDPSKPIFVVNVAARGRLNLPNEGESNKYIAWWKQQRGNYMQTPLVYRGVAYFCADNGMLSAFDAASGEELFRDRLSQAGTGFSASAVAGDGKVYFTGEEGDIYVLSAGRSLKILAHNKLEEICMATPALSEGRLYFRGRDHVICVGE